MKSYALASFAAFSISSLDTVTGTSRRFDHAFSGCLGSKSCKSMGKKGGRER